MKKNYLIIYFLLFFCIGAINAQYKELMSTSGTSLSGSLTVFGNVLYGYSNNGSKFGSIYSVNIDGRGFNNLIDFNGTNGAYPSGSLTLSVTGDTLFGATTGGGSNWNSALHIYGHGCLFSIKKDGSGYNKLFDFNDTNGSAPTGSLLLYKNQLFGMTELGGANKKGCIYSINLNGTNYKKLFDFDSINGASPHGSLIIYGETLFGMTSAGGTTNNGCIFSIKTDGTGYKKLFDFSITNSNGGSPFGDLTVIGNVLYGMTSGNGPYEGCIFSINPNGSGFRDMYDFKVNNGGFPYGSLIFSTNSFYGVTSWGGANNSGVIFSINTEGKGYEKIFDFDKSPHFLTPLIIGDKLYGAEYSVTDNWENVFILKIK